VFEAGEIAEVAIPGQFVQVRTSETGVPFWPRPFSIHDSDPKNGTLAILFKVFGEGTSLLASKLPGQKIKIFGPLGNGFPLFQVEREIIIAAGGIGFPPLYFMAKRSIETGFPADKITFISGAKTRTEHLYEPGLYGLGMKLIVCTDDGSEGFKGHVVEFLKQNLAGYANPVVYACGPSAMLKAADNLLAERKLSGYLSLEALMPCGYGVCSGCAVKVHPPADHGPTDDKRDYHLKRVCVDGPVFQAGEVIW
jgi:dihydroorotate dehydrogenase electron transfer subunit